jgi:predicted ATPase
MLTAPFLREVRRGPDWPGDDEFPFGLPLVRGDPVIAFDSPITMFVGECGSGKSTLLEAIAANAGLGVGGSRHHGAANSRDAGHELHRSLRFSWSIRVRTGFFLRAENFHELASYLDSVGADWGTGELHGQSHGESFLAVCRHRVPHSKRTLVLLDEPEAALSPKRQLDLLGLMVEWRRMETVQVIVATHSPILLGCPGAALMSFDGGVLRPTTWRETEHYQVTRAFLDAPEETAPQVFGSD